MTDSNYAVILEKLSHISEKTDRIDSNVQQADRTLRGFNGDGGLVAKVDQIEGAVKLMKGDLAVYKEGLEGIKTTLHGDGEQKIGIVGEQAIIKRLNKWLIGIATTLIGATLIDFILNWLQSLH